MKIKSLLEKDKTLYSTEWLSLKVTDDGWTYAHEEKGHGVAVLGYRYKNDKKPEDGYEFVGRYEEVPPHPEKKKKLVCLTGMLDVKGEKPLNAALRELKEEAGIKAKEKDVIKLGKAYTSKASDTIHYLFAVDCNDYRIQKADGDGTDGEDGTYSRWIDEKELSKANDPLLHSLYTKLMTKLKIKETKTND